MPQNHYKYMTTFPLMVVLKMNPESTEVKMLMWGKEKPGTKLTFPSMHDSFPTTSAKVLINLVSALGKESRLPLLLIPQSSQLYFMTSF